MARVCRALDRGPRFGAQDTFASNTLGHADVEANKPLGLGDLDLWPLSLSLSDAVGPKGALLMHIHIAEKPRLWW